MNFLILSHLNNYYQIKSIKHNLNLLKNPKMKLLVNLGIRKCFFNLQSYYS